MPSNSNHVCFDCRITRKAGGVCNCGKDLISVGTRWRMPKKNRAKAWADLKELMLKSYSSHLLVQVMTEEQKKNYEGKLLREKLYWESNDLASARKREEQARQDSRKTKKNVLRANREFIDKLERTIFDIHS